MSSKLERLLNLTAVLLHTKQPLTAEEISAKMEGYPSDKVAFRRAFSRDKEDLRQMGVPLRTETSNRSRAEVYRIYADEYYLPDPGLTADELAALHLAALTVQTEGAASDEALHKLGGTSEAAGVDAGLGSFGLNAPAAVASLPLDPLLEPLFRAISENTSVRFSYKEAARAVDPWRLDFARGRWYLIGFDTDRQAERNFRLDRITSAIELVENKTFVAAQTSDAKQRSAWQYGDESTKVCVQIAPQRVAAARQKFATQAVLEDQVDGSLLCTFKVAKFEPFKNMLLGFLEYAELLSPQSWRDEMVRCLQEVKAHHG